MGNELPLICNEPCDCPPGQCAACWGDDDRGQCVNRKEFAVVRQCDACSEGSGCCGTWHDEHGCIPCRLRAAGG